MKIQKDLENVIVAAMVILVAVVIGGLVGQAVYDDATEADIAPVPRSSDNYGWQRVESFTVQGTGTAGAVQATGDTDGVPRGHLYAVHLDYASTISTTTDITLTQASPSLTVLQLTDWCTDTWYYPAAEYTNSSGTGLSAYEPLLVSDRLTLNAGETISGTVVTVTVYYGE